MLFKILVKQLLMIIRRAIDLPSGLFSRGKLRRSLNARLNIGASQDATSENDPPGVVDVLELTIWLPVACTCLCIPDEATG